MPNGKCWVSTNWFENVRSQPLQFITGSSPLGCRDWREKEEKQKDILYPTQVTLPLCSLLPIITIRCNTIYLSLGYTELMSRNFRYWINNSAVITLDKSTGSIIFINLYDSPKPFWNDTFTYLLLFLLPPSSSLVLGGFDLYYLTYFNPYSHRNIILKYHAKSTKLTNPRAD